VELSGRKGEIFREAARLMRENGYAGTSMRDIAAALNLEAASLYNHVASKEVILKEICFGLGAALISSMQEVNDIYFNASERLGMAVRAHIRQLTGNLNFAHVFLHEWRHLSPHVQQEFKQLRHQYEEAFRSILRNGEEEGVFHEVDQKFAVLTILSSLNWVVEWYRPDGVMTPDEIADRLTRFVLNGLKKEG
jgi:AcrR family transcriptional regulator